MFISLLSVCIVNAAAWAGAATNLVARARPFECVPALNKPEVAQVFLEEGRGQARSGMRKVEAKVEEQEMKLPLASLSYNTRNAVNILQRHSWGLGV